MEESYPCPKCDKTFMTQERLDVHSENRIPCDFKCGVCNKACENRNKYDYHMRTRHKKPVPARAPQHDPVIEQAIEQAIVPIDQAGEQPSQYQSIVPIDDFYQLRDYASSVTSQHIHQYQVVNSDPGDNTVKVMEVNAMLTTYTLRAQEIRDMIGEEWMVKVLLCLTHGENDRDKFLEMLLALLKGVHANKETRLHSICMGDVSRRTVNFFSRMAINDKTYWQKCPKDVSIKKIQDHVGTLFSFTMGGATALLKPGLVNATKEPVWMLRTSLGVLTVSLHPLNGNGRRAGMVQKELTPHSLFLYHYRDNADVLDWNDGLDSKEITAIRDAVTDKRNSLIREAQNIKLSRQTCDQFLNESYPICVESMKASRGF